MARRLRIAAKNPAAQALQKLQMEKTTPEQRQEIASKAGIASGKARRKKRTNG